MRIGITFDLKPAAELTVGVPDDLHEEYDSPETILAISAALRSLGHEPEELGNGRAFVEKVLHHPPDLVFNIAEGSGISRNREARVPAVCEMLNIPCTGSDVLTLALALDKVVCRQFVQSAGICIPKGIAVQYPTTAYDGDGAEFRGLIAESDLQLPLIGKPAFEGSSKGIRSRCLIEKIEDLGPVVVSLWRDYHQSVLVEEYIEGDEVTVGVVGNDPPRILGMMQIMPQQPDSRFIYSLEAKRDWQKRVAYNCPPRLAHSTLVALENAALDAYVTLGCRDVARLDFRIRDGQPYFLEANPLPGLNPDSGDIVFIARFMGMAYEQLINTIVQAACQRHLGV